MFVSSQCRILQIVHNREVSPEMEEGKMRDDLVQQLIRGSVVLDTMKQEIHTITAMMGGYLDQGELGEITKKDFDDVSLLGLKDGDRTWLIGRIPNGKIFFVMYITKGDKNRTIYDSMSPMELKSSDVQLVHESLSLLVISLVQTYPKLEELWEPLRTAAQVD